MTTRAETPPEPNGTPGWPPPSGGTWVLDLDGVVWLTGEPIPGVQAALADLHAAGVRTLFATNNSAPTVGELQARLRRAGVEAVPDDLVTSAHAAVTLLEPGSTALPLAGPGVYEALHERGVRVVEHGTADAVVVGWTDRFDFPALAAAADAVRRGARLVGTNEDPALPTPEGLVPGAGALLAAVSTAAGARPTVAGKPHGPLAELIRRRAPDARVVVGDRPSTDGRLAQRLALPFALVLSGVTAPGDVPSDPPAAVVAADLAELVTTTLRAGRADDRDGAAPADSPFQ